MTIDEPGLRQLMEQAGDLHVDAMRGVRASLPALAGSGRERGGQQVNTEEIRRHDAGRRRLLARLGLGSGALVAGGLLPGGIGSLLAGVLAAPARADTPLDVQILQTASSLEVLAANTYATALTLSAVKAGPRAVIEFATRTMQQHNEHKLAFQAQTRVLGGKEQHEPNRLYAQVVEQELPKLRAVADVVSVAKTLETIATETYLEGTSQLDDATSRRILAGVMAVESQHAAVLSTIETLLRASQPDLVQIPFPTTATARLPGAAGNAGFPNPLEPTAQTAPPESGAVE